MENENMYNLFFPIIMASNILLGMQAGVNTSNIERIRLISPQSIQLDNFRIDWDYRESFMRDTIMVADMRPMVVLYFRPTNTITEIVDFCRWSALNVPADTFQIAQEPDIHEGMDGYFGGWGLEDINLYAIQFNACSYEIKNNSDANIAIGISTTTTWKEWLYKFLALSPQGLDVIGVHYYANHNWNAYDPRYMQSIIEYAEQFEYPVWVSELAYGCRNCSSATPEFLEAQAEFVRTAIPDAFHYGAERVYYYGYNPNWNYVDLEDNPLALDAFVEILR